MQKSDSNILFLQRRVALARDEQAYKQLFLHFYTLLHRICFSIIKNAEAAEEIVSDVMIKIWQMEERLTAVNDLKLYLLKAIRNASYTYLAKPEPDILPLDSDDFLPTYFNDASNKIILSETQHRIEKAVAALPPQSQMVFRLVKEEGLPYTQVKEIMGISHNTIKTHMRIALRSIRKAMEETE